MQVRTKTHRTKKKGHPYEIRKLNKTPSCDKPLSVDEFIEQCYGNLPQWSVALRGLRARQGLTQQALGVLIGIAQTNISKMEQGKRPIGKNLANKLATFFKTDYRLFL